MLSPWGAPFAAGGAGACLRGAAHGHPRPRTLTRPCWDRFPVRLVSWTWRLTMAGPSQVLIPICGGKGCAPRGGGARSAPAHPGCTDRPGAPAREPHVRRQCLRQRGRGATCAEVRPGAPGHSPSELRPHFHSPVQHVSHSKLKAISGVTSTPGNKVAGKRGQVTCWSLHSLVQSASTGWTQTH